MIAFDIPFKNMHVLAFGTEEDVPESLALAQETRTKLLFQKPHVIKNYTVLHVQGARTINTRWMARNKDSRARKSTERTLVDEMQTMTTVLGVKASLVQSFRLGVLSPVGQVGLPQLGIDFT